MRDILGIAVAVVIALLSQIVQPWSAPWWAGMIISGTIALFVVAHLIWRARRSHREKSAGGAMTPGDVAFNGAMVAAAIAALAAVWRKRNIAITAAVLAWAAIGFDLWYGPTRGFISLTSRGYPIAWNMISGGIGTGDQLRLTVLEFFGSNDTDKEVTLNDAYIISGMTGAQIPLKVSIFGKQALIKDINPIPPKANVFLVGDLGTPKGLPANDFMKSWGTFSLVVTCDGQTQRFTYDRATIEKMVKPEIPVVPRITLKNAPSTN